MEDYQLIEKFLNKELSKDEKEIFIRKLRSEIEFAKEVRKQLDIVAAIRSAGSLDRIFIEEESFFGRERFTDWFKTVSWATSRLIDRIFRLKIQSSNEFVEFTQFKKPAHSPLYYVLSTAAVSALLIGSIVIFIIYREGSKQIQYSKYAQLLAQNNKDRKKTQLIRSENIMLNANNDSLRNELQNVVRRALNTDRMNNYIQFSLFKIIEEIVNSGTRDESVFFLDSLKESYPPNKEIEFNIYYEAGAPFIIALYNNYGEMIYERTSVELVKLNPGLYSNSIILTKCGLYYILVYEKNNKTNIVFEKFVVK